MLSPNEESMLMAVLHNGENAYGAQIFRTFQEWGDPKKLGVVYMTLDRLEKKGFISGAMSESTSAPGGRARKVYAVEGSGQRALYETRQKREKREASNDWHTLIPEPGGSL